MKFFSLSTIPIQKVNSLSKNGVTTWVKREDLIHPKVSGNKFRKLKYNVEHFLKNNYNAILTFGGAYSNHIAAVATLTKELNIPTIGVVRGEELEIKFKENTTLNYAHECGMKLKFISRKEYKNKENKAFLNSLYEEFGEIYILPEGGTNELAVKGCEEILDESTEKFQFISCAMGTAGTISGIIRSANSNQQILGFPALKNSDWMDEEIKKFTPKTNFKIVRSYHFGGYAKYNADLITFVTNFKKENKIPIEPIYTGKMAYGLNELINQNYFAQGSNVLMIHTGGLQGLDGFNNKLNKKGLNLL